VRTNFLERNFLQRVLSQICAGLDNFREKDSRSAVTANEAAIVTGKVMSTGGLDWLLRLRRQKPLSLLQEPTLFAA
jgi:hypothetical protein